MRHEFTRRLHCAISSAQLNIWPLTSNEILLSAFGWRKGIFARSGTINCGPAAGCMALPGMNALSHSSIDRIVFQQALFEA
jgi:hypothetical protein